MNGLEMGLIADQEQRRGCGWSLPQKLCQAAAERTGHAGGPIGILNNRDRKPLQLGPQLRGGVAQNNNDRRSTGSESQRGCAAQERLSLMPNQLFGLAETGGRAGGQKDGRAGRARGHERARGARRIPEQQGRRRWSGFRRRWRARWPPACGRAGRGLQERGAGPWLRRR